jgi:hypothetical protein
MQQCPECYMVFALPPIGDRIVEKALEKVALELKRHFEQNHPQ